MSEILRHLLFHGVFEVHGGGFETLRVVLVRFVVHIDLVLSHQGIHETTVQPLSPHVSVLVRFLYNFDLGKRELLRLKL